MGFSVLRHKRAGRLLLCFSGFGGQGGASFSNGTVGFHDQGGSLGAGELYLKVYFSARNGGQNRAAVNVEHASRLRENERDAH